MDREPMRAATGSIIGEEMRNPWDAMGQKAHHGSFFLEWTPAFAGNDGGGYRLTRRRVTEALVTVPWGPPGVSLPSSM